jgi:hypothetical protein
LEALTEIPITNERHVCWSQFLSRFQISLTYLQSSENIFADFLSRPEGVAKKSVFSGYVWPKLSPVASQLVVGPRSRLDWLKLAYDHSKSGH